MLTTPIFLKTPVSQFSVLRWAGHSAKGDHGNRGVHYQSDPKGLTSSELGLVSSLIIWFGSSQAFQFEISINLNRPRSHCCFSDRVEKHFRRI